MVKREDDPEHIVLIDTDPYFLMNQELFIMQFAKLYDFGNILIKYLFCMYLVIKTRDILDDIKLYVLSILDTISSQTIVFSDKPYNFIEIISLFYNDYKTIFKDEHQSFIKIINEYHLNPLQNFITSSYSEVLFKKYIHIRKFLVNCKAKVAYETNMFRKYFTINIIVKFNKETNTISYTLNGKEIHIISISEEELIYKDETDEKQHTVKFNKS
jgi:hypothetical protein